MKQQIKDTIASEIAKFHLPRYEDIPNVGLYLEQTVQYICEYLEPLQESAITGSMISNYVKKKLVENPVKKKYYRDQIANIIFIAVTKSVLSLENIRVLLNIRRERFDIKAAYDYFCDSLENTVGSVFGLCDDPVECSETVFPGDRKNGHGIADEISEERDILQNTIIAVAHKLYLDHWITEYADSL